MSGAAAAHDEHWRLAGERETVPTTPAPTLRDAVADFLDGASPGCRHARDDVAVIGILSDPTRQVWCGQCALRRAFVYGVEPQRCDLCARRLTTSKSAVFTTTGRTTVIAATCGPCPTERSNDDPRP